MLANKDLISHTGGGSRDEDTRRFASELATSPKLTGCVPEGLELAREVTETGGDTEEEGVEVGKLLIDGSQFPARGRSTVYDRTSLGASTGYEGFAGACKSLRISSGSVSATLEVRCSTSPRSRVI